MGLWSVRDNMIIGSIMPLVPELQLLTPFATFTEDDILSGMSRALWNH